MKELHRRRYEDLKTLIMSGNVPSVQELKERWGLQSPWPVQRSLDVMESEGLIRRIPGQTRNIRLTGEVPF